MNAIANALAATAAAVLIAGSAMAQQLTMKISSPVVNDVTQEWARVFKAGIEARAAGKLKVEYYPANQLGQIPATVDGVALGTIEMTVPAAGFFIALEPRFVVFDTPGLFDSIVHGQKVLADPDIRKRIATFGEQKGIEPLITFVHGPMMLLSHKPVRALADFKGQKIRVPGGAPVHIEPYRKLGAAPLSMPFGEVLPAMQNKAIDGLIASIQVYPTFKYYDIAKGLTYLPGTFLVASGAVNKKWIKSLGADLEAAVRDEARKAETVFSTWGVEAAQQARALWEKNGGQTITLAADESRRFLDDVAATVAPILAANPRVKEDYEALLAAAKKYRQ